MRMRKKSNETVWIKVLKFSKYGKFILSVFTKIIKLYFSVEINIDLAVYITKLAKTCDITSVFLRLCVCLYVCLCVPV